MRVLSLAVVFLVTGWGYQVASAEEVKAAAAPAAKAAPTLAVEAPVPAAAAPPQATVAKPGAASPMSGVLAGYWEFVYAAYLLTAAGLLGYIGWTLRAWRQAEGRSDG